MAILLTGTPRASRDRVGRAGTSRPEEAVCDGSTCHFFQNTPAQGRRRQIEGVARRCNYGWPAAGLRSIRLPRRFH